MHHVICSVFAGWLKIHVLQIGVQGTEQTILLIIGICLDSLDGEMFPFGKTV